MARHPGAHSVEFYRNQATLLEHTDSSTRCWFCGHGNPPGLWQVNHVVERRDGGGDGLGNLVPAHGHDDRRGRSGRDYRCFECSPTGVACNQSFRRGARQRPAEPSYRSRDW